MRLLALLMIGLPAPLWSQSQAPGAATLPVAAEATWVEPADPAAEARQPTTDDGAAAADVVTAEPRADELASSEVAAQPTMRNFLYQVFLAAVTALVTALIWKAVF